MTVCARHVRLGDIVAATWGIADYDHVMETEDGPRPRQPFPLPSPMLVGAARLLAALEIAGDRHWESLIARRHSVTRPRDSSDVVYAARSDRVIPHPPTALSGHRPGQPKVHHGLIGSADRGLRSAAFRDARAAAHGMIAFEMEGKGIAAAGFANNLQWFVVRGISDYGDARTDVGWRPYASTVAAAYLRTLLAECLPLRPRDSHSQPVTADRA